MDIALLPIGGHCTMDCDDAAYAAGLIGPAGDPDHHRHIPSIKTDARALPVTSSRREWKHRSEPGQTASLIRPRWSRAILDGPRRVGD